MDPRSIQKKANQFFTENQERQIVYCIEELLGK